MCVISTSLSESDDAESESSVITSTDTGADVGAGAARSATASSGGRAGVCVGGDKDADVEVDAGVGVGADEGMSAGAVAHAGTAVGGTRDGLGLLLGLWAWPGSDKRGRGRADVRGRAPVWAGESAAPSVFPPERWDVSRASSCASTLAMVVGRVRRGNGRGGGPDQGWATAEGSARRRRARQSTLAGSVGLLLAETRVDVLLVRGWGWRRRSKMGQPKAANAAGRTRDAPPTSRARRRAATRLRKHVPSL